ncbi:hypothetical protein F2P44_31560 [Massilia sp. CCM 8695]|uniref:Head-tail adaptor protein n=1 Tax=Massilia frigida TaxID=2609281 RepID=A0ABX0NII7_9BURK|nr:head-tail adaptor protein [Massilia frigida]NHZ83771.1 hypothetical protein [Massilia frigida]
MKTFTENDKVTIERRAAGRHPEYNTPLDSWVVVESRIWANVQDILPSRAESTNDGLRLALQRSRLRIRNNSAITAEMRVTLHSRGDRLMQIIAGPALLDDRERSEYILEGYSI